MTLEEIQTEEQGTPALMSDKELSVLTFGTTATYEGCDCFVGKTNKTDLISCVCQEKQLASQLISRRFVVSKISDQLCFQRVKTRAGLGLL